MTPKARKKEYGSALVKAIAVLEAVVDQPQAIGLPDLTARLGMPRQTVHRILQNLEANGLILRDPARERYRIGPRLSRLALNTIHSRNQSAPIREILQGLVDDIRETCNIGVLDGGDFIYLERIECDWSLRVHLEAGSRVPAYCTSGGKALLAHLPTDLREGLLATLELKAHTGRTIVERAALESELAEIRERGFSSNDEEYTVGIVGVAVPVMLAAARPVAALACHAPAARISLGELHRYVPRLHRAAEQLAEVWRAGAASAGVAA